MIYENYIRTNKNEFVAKLQLVSQKLNIHPEWLMIVMWAESRLNEKAINPISGATGLIQFMPKTAQGLGTSTANLYLMSNVEQLDYVFQYFKPYAGKLKSVYDLYLVTFFPVALGKPDDFVMQTSTLSAKVIAKQNPGIDINKDLQITVGEFKQYVDRYVKKKILNQIA